MKATLSFKRRPKNTGLTGVGYPSQNVDIKINQKRVGYISAPNWTSQQEQWVIRIAIEKDDKHTDNNPNCPWMWVRKGSTSDENIARAFVKANIGKWLVQYKLHSFD